MADKITTPEDAVPRKLQLVSPAAIAEAMEDPGVFEHVARGDLYVEMGRLRKIMANPNTPSPVRLEYIKQLAQMGKVARPEQTGLGPLANIPTIQIIFPNSGQTTTIGAAPRVINTDE